MKRRSYNHKITWILLFLGITLMLIFLFFIHNTVTQLRNEEIKKIKLWANAVSRKIEVLDNVKTFFDNLAIDEHNKVQQFITAHKYILSQPLDKELNFYYEFISNNRTIPVIITDEFDNILLSQNIEIPKSQTKLSGKLLEDFSVNQPIEYTASDIKFKLFYSESTVYSNIKNTLYYLSYDFLSEIVNNSVSIPVIITDSSQSTIIAHGNIDEKLLKKPFFNKLISEMESANNSIAINLPNYPNAKIFYESPTFLTFLRYYPPIFTLLIILFAFLIIQLLKITKKSEENSIWIGMNKETAHQLGTPISSLMAWVEYLKLNPENEMVCTEISKDIDKLNVITQRFSQVGKTPKKIELNILDIIQNTVDYIKSRTSKKVNYEIILPEENCINIELNQHLFEWALENLIKNAIDAMNGIGDLRIEVKNENKKIFIDVSDTGKGVPKRDFKKIFSPGFTTKERGWGMGLSLVKRIIEEYHKGKVFLKQSSIGKGSTFRIILKKEK
ncbi:MAG: HAMP domain-containing sensor histidine kinase [Bacteroidales bacterium]|nr:HAMP domain-containing sensor histidine kinase [Bacteroidales bacterium]